MNKADMQIAKAIALLNSALTLLDDVEHHAAAAEIDHVIKMLQIDKNTAPGT
jgi:hypothetical protein